MKKFRAQAPYNSSGKTNFRYTSGKPGVYLIYHNGVLRYVGMSQTDVYKTMYRHFQSWEDPTQVRITYKNPYPTYKSVYSCRVVLCTAAQAVKLERMLIIKHRPKDNPNKYHSYKPNQVDNKLVSEFIGTPVESCPF